MLAVLFKHPYTNSAFNYLQLADISDSQWLTRNRGEAAVVICDEEIELTDDLIQYLHYFAATTDKNIRHTLTSFSNLPIKEE